MKKQVKKLVLAKETLRSLDVVHLRSVAGGDTAWICEWQPITEATCNGVTCIGC